MQKENLIKIICVLVIVASVVFISTKAMGVTIGGNLNMGSNKITDLGSPTVGTDAVNLNSLITAIRGGGSVNYIPKWDATFALVNSKISDDGTNLNFGQAPADSFVLQKVTNQATMSPAPAVGQIWMCVDADMKCDG